MAGPDPAPADPSDPRRLAPEAPGVFVSDDLRSDTERFLGEVKRLVQVRRERDAEPGLPPPRD